jgi:hypothetical protein
MLATVGKGYTNKKSFRIACLNCQNQFDFFINRGDVMRNGFDELVVTNTYTPRNKATVICIFCNSNRCKIYK